MSNPYKDDPMGCFADYEGCESGMIIETFDCDHIVIVSINETECQCIDCLRVWPINQRRTK
jgi:hypothetical protein